MPSTEAWATGLALRAGVLSGCPESRWGCISAGLSLGAGTAKQSCCAAGTQALRRFQQ